MSKKIKIIIGLTVSIVLSAYLIFKIDFKSVLNELSSFNPLCIFFLLFIYLIGIVLRTARWKILLDQKNEVSFKIAFKALITGYMLNNLLPAKLGEFARAEYLKRTQVTHRSFALGTILIERLADIVIVLLFLVFSILFSETTRNIVYNNKASIIILVLILSVITYLNCKTSNFTNFHQILTAKNSGCIQSNLQFVHVLIPFHQK